MTPTGLGRQRYTIERGKVHPQEQLSRPRSHELCISCQGSEASFACRESFPPLFYLATAVQRRPFKTSKPPAGYSLRQALDGVDGTTYGLRASPSRHSIMRPCSKYREHMTTVQTITVFLSQEHDFVTAFATVI